MTEPPLLNDKENQPVTPELDKPFWTISRDLEISARTQKLPADDLVNRLNHMVSQPPFCWVYKAKRESSEIVKKA